MARNYVWKEKIVLIVEDDIISGAFLKEALDDMESRNLLATCGEDAIKMFTAEKVDVVLMDIQLPDIDGWQLTEMFKKMKPEVPIIAQTAFAMQEDRIRCAEAGCDDYIEKPTSLDALKDKLNFYLKKV